MSADGVAALADRIEMLTGELNSIDGTLSMIMYAIDGDTLTKEVLYDSVNATRAHIQRIKNDFAEICQELSKEEFMGLSEAELYPRAASGDTGAE